MFTVIFYKYLYTCKLKSVQSFLLSFFQIILPNRHYSVEACHGIFFWQLFFSSKSGNLSFANIRRDRWSVLPLRQNTSSTGVGI